MVEWDEGDERDPLEVIFLGVDVLDSGFLPGPFPIVEDLADKVHVDTLESI